MTEENDDPDDREGDPFERIEEFADREDDPFANLDPGDNGDGATDEASAWSDIDPTVSRSGRENREESEPDRVDPGEFPDETEEVPDETDEVFDQAGVDEIDHDTVWEQLDASPTESEGSERSYAEVSKHRYCEQCEYFSAPPDASCTHEGTEIVAYLDMETVRVVDCPVVAQREAIERQE